VSIDPGGPEQRPDDLSGHAHRQTIGYLGLVLPLLLWLMVRVRPPAPSYRWVGTSLSDYYWTGAVSIFVGIVAALSVYLLTYRGYANGFQKYDRAAAIIAGVAAAVIILFPTTPPAGMPPLSWWNDAIASAHTVASIVLFSMFAIFSLWLFRLTAPGEMPTRAKRWRNAVYLGCGFGILIGMGWAVYWRHSGRRIFLPESVAVISFAVSWLVKGQALGSIRSTLHAATNRIIRRNA
jgi:hypothetical protein